ncbi:MAG TPA: hypothetical protein VI306_25655 [Pyrinomonadaceae bacterium]
MSNTFSYLVIISGVILLALGMSFIALQAHHENSFMTFGRFGSRPAVVSLSSVLQAHGGATDIDWQRFSQQGTLTYYTGLSSVSRQQVQRKLNFLTDGPNMKYDRASLGSAQTYLFLGDRLVRTTSETGTKQEAKEVEGVEAAGIKFQIATFGLAPVLKRLSDPGAKVRFVSSGSKGDQFEVKTSSGFWYFYCSSSHLIERLEIGEITVTYDDYRTIDGLKMPFHQNVSKGDTLLYEISLEAFTLKPVFARGLFQS